MTSKKGKKELWSKKAHWLKISSLRHAELMQLITRFLDDVEKEAPDFKNEDVITALVKKIKAALLVYRFLSVRFRASEKPLISGWRIARRWFALFAMRWNPIGQLVGRGKVSLRQLETLVWPIQRRSSGSIARKKLPSLSACWQAKDSPI